MTQLASSSSPGGQQAARGKFITIEGAEGVGKSTNIAFMKEFLTQQGIAVISTREPGGTPISESIRKILLNTDNASMHNMTELMLVFAARRQHIEGLIRPALAAGTWVISDRFTDSTYAYQGGGRGLPDSLIKQVEDLALDGFHPDLTIILDMDAAEGLQRARALGEADRFEMEGREFYQRVRQTFLDRASSASQDQAGQGRYRLVDASQSLAMVQADLQAIMLESL